MVVSRTSFTESVVEQAALSWHEWLGWMIQNGPEIAPGERTAEQVIRGN